MLKQPGPIKFNQKNIRMISAMSKNKPYIISRIKLEQPSLIKVNFNNIRIFEKSINLV